MVLGHFGCRRYGPGQGTTDEVLMAKLGEILGGNMKEDFMVRTSCLPWQQAQRFWACPGSRLSNLGSNERTRRWLLWQRMHCQTTRLSFGL